MYEYKVKKVVKIIDGDTIDIDIDLGFYVTTTQRIRLAGIDTPETRTKDLLEKRLGLEAKQWLTDKLATIPELTIVTVKDDAEEKYGRLLGWLYEKSITASINEQMITLGYAWKYDGAKKEKDLDELLNIRKNMV
jgi:micrococcal nuclease